MTYNSSPTHPTGAPPRVATVSAYRHPTLPTSSPQPASQEVEQLLNAASERHLDTLVREAWGRHPDAADERDLSMTC